MKNNDFIYFVVIKQIRGDLKMLRIFNAFIKYLLGNVLYFNVYDVLVTLLCTLLAIVSNIKYKRTDHSESLIVYNGLSLNAK